MARCQAIIGNPIWRSQIELRQQCQQTAAHWPDGVGLCGTHFNAGFRKELTVVRELRLLHDGDM